MFLLNEFLEESARRFPEKEALICGPDRLTYRVLDEATNRLARALIAAGVERGDRVVVYLENSVEAVVSIFGILKAGAIFLTVNPTTKADKLTYILNNSRAKALISHQQKGDVISEALSRAPSIQLCLMAGSPEEHPRYVNFESFVAKAPAAPLPRRAIDVDLATIIYTSGSTGNPKGVMMTHHNMISAAKSITTYLENTSDDIILNVLPLAFDYGLYQVLMAFFIGGTLVLERSFLYPYAVLETMLREKVTGFPGVPTIFAILLQLDLSKYDFPHLRYISNTAAALPVEHIRRIREAFPKATLYSMYGLTECKRVSYLPPDQLDIRPTSVGKGMPNEEGYIVDEHGNRAGPGVVGELVVRGSNVMRGYWENPEATDRVLKDGPYPGEKVLYTGDLFKMDEEGYLYFVASKDDIIKSRGEKVSHREVEDVLYALEGILEAAVIGVPDTILGQAVKATVVLKEGYALKEKDILRHCAKHLEDFMVPKIVEIRDSLPKTATGKIKKTDLH